MGTLGGHFGVTGAPREAILAPRDHPGGPWEQQDGPEVVNNRVLVDFVLVLGLFYVNFGFRMLKVLFCGIVSKSSFR